MAADLGAAFRAWLGDAFPDGIGSGTGGAYHQDDLEQAFEAGVAFVQARAGTIGEWIVTGNRPANWPGNWPGPG